MATNNFPLTSRITDIAHKDSELLKVVGPRDFTALQLATFTAELYELEAAIWDLATFVQAHRAAPAGVGGWLPTTVSFSILSLGTVGVHSVGPGLIKAHGVSLLEGLGTTPPAGGTYTAGPVELRVGDTVIFSHASRTPMAVHAALRALPVEMYSTLGAMLEELAATYYKGRGDASSVTALERMAIIRLQGRNVKALVDAARQVPITTAAGLIVGADEYTGLLMARDAAEAAIRALAPVIAEWVFDREPLGTSLVPTAIAASE